MRRKYKVTPSILKHKKKHGTRAAIYFAQGYYGIPKGKWGKFEKKFRKELKGK